MTFLNFIKNCLGLSQALIDPGLVGSLNWVGVGPRGFGTGLDNWHTIRGKSQAEKSDQQIKSKAALPQSDC